MYPERLDIRQLLESSRDAVIVANAETQRIVLWNSAATNIFGYSISEALGLHVEALVPRHLKDQHRAGMARYSQTGSGSYIDSHRLLELPALRKGGKKIHVELSLSSIGLVDDTEDGERFVLAIVRDITERKALEEQLAYQALHDPLTDLPNRTLFTDRLQHALAQAHQREGRVAVLSMDLDDFKFVIDRFGYQIVDRLNAAVAARLSACIQPRDTIARFGGDKFALLLENFTDADYAVRVAKHIMREMQAPFTLDEHELFITISIGIALSTSRAEDSLPEGLLRNADIALYEAKNKGKARYALYDEGMHSRIWARLQLEDDLRRAIDEGQFRIYYQPEVLLETGDIFGVEALIRWEHPERGLVFPEEFIPLAEETGLILPLGRLVLEEACRQAGEWRNQHQDNLPKMCINLSVRQLHQPSLAHEIGQVLQQTGLGAHNMLFEITESVMIEDAELLIGTLGELRALGVELAIDDFGVGYSSLSYLKRLPANYLKIHHSFVRGLKENLEDADIVEAVIKLAHTLGLKVIAEGVETEEQLRHLKALDCDLAQGYYFSEPLPAAHISEILANRSSGSRR